MPIDFPNTPADGDSYSAGGKTWVYNGTSATWVLFGLPSALANGSVSTNHLGSEVVHETKIASSAVTAAKIATDAVIESKIATGAVSAAKLASNSVTEAKINDGAVTQNKMASGLSAITVTTTALRSTVVPSPFVGQFIFLTDTSSLQRWNGSSWVSAITTVPTSAPTGLALVSATTTTATISFTPGEDGGSNIINYQYSLSTNGGSTFGDYTALSPADGSSPITVTGLTVSTSYQIKLRAVNALGTGATESSALSFSTQGLSVEYLVVAGGGGGGCGHGGGGGAGGYRTGTTALGASTQTVTVGGGGSGGVYSSAASTAGGNSVFGSISATGGGRGAGQDPQYQATTGGSGGGGGYTTAGVFSGAAGNAGGYTPVEGYAGGTPPATQWVGAGGGGSSGVGTYTGAESGGGPGTANSITGSSVTYAAGGSGQANTDGTVAGGANTGNGGGGRRQTSAPAGGSGIVVVRYLTSAASGITITGGTKVVGPAGAPTYTVHTFTTSGSLVIS